MPIGYYDEMSPSNYDRYNKFRKDFAYVKTINKFEPTNFQLFAVITKEKVRWVSG